MINDIKQDAESRMRQSIEHLKTELSKVRTGRAHVSLLDHLKVDFYGSQVPISQAASVSVGDARSLVVQPWDKEMVSVIEKAIMESDLGLNPNTAGTTIRIVLPALTEERRKELTKVVHPRRGRKCQGRDSQYPPRCQQIRNGAPERQADYRGRGASSGKRDPTINRQILRRRRYGRRNQGQRTARNLTG